MTTGIEANRLRRQVPDDQPGGPSARGSAPRADERAVRAAAEERLTELVSGGREFGPCDPIPDPVLLRTEAGDAHAVDLNDIRQGQFGDCFVLAPLGALTRTPEGRALIERAVVENRDSGGSLVSYTVTLHLPQRDPSLSDRFPEVKITVEPFFECGHGRPRVEKESAEVWPLVIEKAYAQLVGGYSGIRYGGIPKEAMEILTGKPASREATTWFSAPTSAASVEADLAAGKIVVFETRDDLEPLSCRHPPALQSSMTLPGSYNLYPHHAYVALGTEVRDGKEYLLLHNPWDRDQPDAVPFDEVRQWFKAVDVGSVK